MPLQNAGQRQYQVAYKSHAHCYREHDASVEFCEPAGIEPLSYAVYADYHDSACQYVIYAPDIYEFHQPCLQFIRQQIGADQYI